MDHTQRVNTMEQYFVVLLNNYGEINNRKRVMIFYKKLLKYAMSVGTCMKYLIFELS